MLRRAAAALFGLVLLTVTANAAGLTGMGANIHGSFFHFPPANLDKHMVHKISVGKTRVTLSETRLVELRKVFGGTIKSGGGATWLCYVTDDATTWFISNALGGQEFVMMVAVQNATGSVPSDCEAAGTKFSTPVFDVPSLGATTADLKSHFGIAPGSGGKITYRADEPGGYSDIAQYLGYVIKGGKVVGVGMGETSVVTQH
ncbi:MAG: hypothetical protein ABIO40_12805 [Devosia sp.]